MACSIDRELVAGGLERQEEVKLVVIRAILSNGEVTEGEALEQLLLVIFAPSCCRVLELRRVQFPNC